MTDNAFDEIMDNLKHWTSDEIHSPSLLISLDDGSWGLIRASSNKPSLVVVVESPSSDDRKKKIFEFIDSLLKETGQVGDYDQKI